MINNIHYIAEQDNFFNLFPFMDIAFGSFARKTKIRPLDDIDLMICLHADGSEYIEFTDRIELLVKNTSSPQMSCCSDMTNILNSTKVINRFIAELSLLSDYKKSELHKRGESVTLQLKSYSWNFDIVPCFYTRPTFDGKTYYLIPDGRGNWKKTDPRKDRNKVSEVNQKNEGKLLSTIRIMKYWNKRKTMPTMQSYLLECMIVDYFDNNLYKANNIHIRFIDALLYIISNIFNPVYDPKGIQGNLNNLSRDEMLKISNRAIVDYNKALEAYNLEVSQDYRASITKWGEIFGENFPTYTSW